jgi:polar amino acid transport system substrate-binding protein
MKNLIIIAGLLSFAVSAAEIDLRKLKLPNNRTITLTGHPAYPPVVWATRDGKELQGIAVELLKMIFKEVNIEVSVINVETWGRAQEEVKNGRIDILLPPYKTSERQLFYNYSNYAFMMDETAVFVKK